MKSKKKKINIKGLIKNNYYFLIVVLVLIATYFTVNTINNSLNTSEQKLFDIVEENKNTFKNPQSIKVVSAKICNNDYSIISITANNSFGAETTDTYYVNKNTMTTDEVVSKAVAKKCFEEELNNYNSVMVLSKNSISKINNLIGGQK